MKKMREKLTAAALAALLLLGLHPAVRQSDSDDLKDDRKELTEEKKEIEDQLAQLKNDKANAVQRRTLLDQQISLTEREIANTEAQIAGYEALLAQTAYELEENQREEAERYALFCERARVMEEAGTTSYWAVLFKAESFSDLLSRLSDVQEVMNYDQGVLDSLRQLRTEIEEKQIYQEELKAGAQEAMAEREEKKEEEELAAQMAAAQMDWTASSGGYIWPESVSRRITSPMGPRNTGIPGASTNHKGVDIGGVGYTTTVVATKAGVVITSARSSSYGEYVVISHGPGNTTLYAHMSSRSVKEGDVVTQGQAIGITGSTGISNGAHLHYEITEGGSRIDPLLYLPGYIQAW